jgi:photosystem I P700 chlorophyll a apoprotein A2
LIETLAWAQDRTPLANLIRWRDKPVALSIVQARLVGLAHFSVGYIFTYAAFLIALHRVNLVNLGEWFVSISHFFRWRRGYTFFYFDI